MITRTARIDSETDIAQLARAVFRIEKGHGGASLMTRAERALLAANPSLGNELAFVPERRIVVPRVEGLALTARVRDDGESIGNPAFEALSRLSRIAMTLDERAGAAKRRRQQLIDRAGGEEVRAIVEKELEGGIAVLDEAIAATRRDQQSEAARIETLRTALDGARLAFEKIAQKDAQVPESIDRDLRRERRSTDGWSADG